MADRRWDGFAPNRRAVALALAFAWPLGAAAATLPARDGLFDVRRYGARGDGATVDSPAINRAIEAAAAAGGGAVVIPPGRYLCFSIRMKSRITLVLSDGAVVVAADPKLHKGAYDPPEGIYTEQFEDYVLAHAHTSLIYGDGVTDAAIVGRGMLQGLGLDRAGPGPRWHGVAGWKSPAERGLTPDAARRADPNEMAFEGRGNKAVAFTNSHNVLLRDFTILQGGHMACLVQGSTNVTIDSLTIDTDRDGIDIDACRDLRIVNCIVNAPKDDAIVLKSTLANHALPLCENIIVSGCKTSGWLMGTLLDGTYRPSPYRAPDDLGVLGRIKLGTESDGGFRNVRITDCTCENSRGLQMGAIDGGVLEDVAFSNIILKDPVNHPLFVRLSARNRAPVGTGVSRVRRVSFSDIEVSGADGRYACGVVGIPDGIIEDVTLANVRVRSRGGGVRADAERQVPEKRDSSLEPSFMGTMPAYGFYARHVRNLALDQVCFEVEQADARPAVALEDVDGASIDGLRSPTDPRSAVRAEGCRNTAFDHIVQLS